MAAHPRPASRLLLLFVVLVLAGGLVWGLAVAFAASPSPSPAGGAVTLSGDTELAERLTKAIAPPKKMLLKMPLNRSNSCTKASLPPATDPLEHPVVLTKADQVKPGELAERIAEIEAALSKRPAAFPRVLATSSEKGGGIPDLRAEIMTVCAA